MGSVVGRTLPDIVLMDIHLRGPFDGIEAACEIHAQFDVGVIYVTGHSDAETVKRAKLAEPLGYVLKPIDFTELHNVIEKAIHRHEAERAERGKCS